MACVILRDEAPERVGSGTTRSTSPRSVTEIMRQKVLRWCVLGRPEGQDPELVAFYSATSAERAECRARLAQSLTSLHVTTRRATRRAPKEV